MFPFIKTPCTAFRCCSFTSSTRTIAVTTSKISSFYWQTALLATMRRLCMRLIYSRQDISKSSSFPSAICGILWIKSGTRLWMWHICLRQRCRLHPTFVSFFTSFRSLYVLNFTTGRIVSVMFGLRGIICASWKMSENGFPTSPVREEHRCSTKKNSLELIELSSIHKVSLVQVFSCSNTGSIRYDPYWTPRKNSLELIALSSINKVSLV